ncbi:MAG: slipin family protein [Candidatus Micrarchaeota archaeon]
MNNGPKLVIGLILAAIAVALLSLGLWIFLPIYIILLLALSIRIVQQYQTGVIFSLGRMDRTLQAGLNFIFPFIERVRIIDMRITTIDIPRQQAITKDNVPVTINGVLYFKVVDASKAIINVQDYEYAVSQYAQTALRDVVGGQMLDEVLAEREQIGKQIETIVEKESIAWGIEVTSIKMQDIDMPEDLKRLMSRQASSEREKRATIIKAEGDRMAADNLAKAAEIMAKMPGAMQLRTLQTIDGLGPTASNTVVIAVPIEIMDAVNAFIRHQGKTGKKK